MKRRQFLADALFAGGALGATALAARWMLGSPGSGEARGTAGLVPGCQPVVAGEFEPVSTPPQELPVPGQMLIAPPPLGAPPPPHTGSHPR